MERERFGGEIFSLDDGAVRDVFALDPELCLVCGGDLRPRGADGLPKPHPGRAGILGVPLLSHRLHPDLGLCNRPGAVYFFVERIGGLGLDFAPGDARGVSYRPDHGGGLAKWGGGVVGDWELVPDFEGAEGVSGDAL